MKGSSIEYIISISVHEVDANYNVLVDEPRMTIAVFPMIPLSAPELDNTIRKWGYVQAGQIRSVEEDETFNPEKGSKNKC
jgi:hypothetical protein